MPPAWRPRDVADRDPAGTWVLRAAAGYGKSVALAALADEQADRGRGPAASPPLVLDDVHRLDRHRCAALSRRIAALPPEVAVLLCSRDALPDQLLAVAPEPVRLLGPEQLALSAEVVARTLHEEHGVVDVDLAFEVHDRTAGWPMPVQLAGLALGGAGARGPRPTVALTGARSPLARWLRREVLAGLDPDAIGLLQVCAGLDLVTEPLCRAIARCCPRLGEPAAVAETLDRLLDSGLLAGHPRVAVAGGAPALRVVPVLGSVLREGIRAVPADPAAGRDLLAARPSWAPVAVGWLSDHDQPLSAALLAGATGDRATCLTLVAGSGDQMLAAGGAAEVVRILQGVPPDRITDRLRLVLGDAQRVSGDLLGAEQTFRPMLARGATGRLSSAAAWRVGMVRYLGGDYAGAAQVYERADEPICDPAGSADRDDVLLATCRAGAAYLLGDAEAAVRQAERAMAMAASCPDPHPLAAAHLTMALTGAGAGRDDHLARAIAGAESAGDVVLLARALVNRSDTLLREADYPAALAAAERAGHFAGIGGPPGVLVTALNNVGEALTRLGDFDRAALHFQRSIAICRRLGLRRTAMGLCGLAELTREQGRRGQSMAAFEEALGLARVTAEVQVLVPALAGLARLLVDGPDPDLDRAEQLADEAVEAATPDLTARARAAAGWVALAGGRLDEARRHGAQAVAAARDRRAVDALADALELCAVASTDGQERRTALQQAYDIWHAAGAVTSADRILVMLGRLPDSDGPRRSAAREAERRLVAAGIQVVDGSALFPTEGTAAPVRIQVLGGFAVIVAGRPVPITAWRSRQARTLLKILVSRRGRPVPRGELCELLWPGDDPGRTGHRLSVLLNAVRGVLDPGRTWPVEHYLRADLAGVSIDPSHLSVDAHELLRDAEHALTLSRAGEQDGAREALAEVDAAYRGDAFEDDPYEAWTDALREQVRAAWLAALRRLTELARDEADGDRAVRCLLRLLSADPYDEWGHRGLVEVLVRAGRHGEAERAFDRWAGAMRSIDVAGPDRAVLARG